jgi:16S rRNA (guanine1207-N2)-methyltransferase
MIRPPVFVDILRRKIRFPLAVALGAPGEVAGFVAALAAGPVTCYQMDLYQADRLREELARYPISAEVVTAPDLWNCGADFQSVFLPVPERGERALKIDMVEQAFHVLCDRGTLIVASPYEKDQFFPDLLKKVFGRVHATAATEGMVFWSQRDGYRRPRRHEVIFHARIGDGPSLRFLSRPGVFSYGRLDDGARALLETMTIERGDRILDIGCGSGTNGIGAGLRSGPTGQVVFVDSNLRAVALAEHNARENGLPTFQTVASSKVEGLPDGTFDVALANPPYYAQGAIARLFVQRAKALLRPEGRMYLVTKQADQVGPLVAEVFGITAAVERRGYVVLCARAKG